MTTQTIAPRRYDSWVKTEIITGDFTDIDGNVWPQAWVDTYNQFGARLKACIALHPESIPGSLADQEINFYLDQRHRHYQQCRNIMRDEKNKTKKDGPMQPEAESEFLRGYMLAAVELIDVDENLDVSPTVSDIPAELKEQIRCEVMSFYLGNKDLLVKACNEVGYSWSQAGVDLFLTRNHHGAGFWDRHLGPVGDELTEKAHEMGSCDFYLGDDGRVAMLSGFTATLNAG